MPRLGVFVDEKPDIMKRIAYLGKTFIADLETNRKVCSKSYNKRVTYYFCIPTGASQLSIYSYLIHSLGLFRLLSEQLQHAFTLL